MATKQDISMPQDLDLVDGWSLRVTAVDATGTIVPGVTVSNMAIVADAPLGAAGGSFDVGPFMLVGGPGA